jgi:hypothetical protein
VSWLVVHDEVGRSNRVVGVYHQLVIVQTPALLCQDRVETSGRSGQARAVLQHLASLTDHDLVQENSFQR